MNPFNMTDTEYDRFLRESMDFAHLHNTHGDNFAPPGLYQLKSAPSYGSHSPMIWGPSDRFRDPFGAYSDTLPTYDGRTSP